MHMITVNGSTIESIDYYAESETLVVKFYGGGVYEYHDVPSRVHDELRSASSVDIYFHEQIWDRYDDLRIG